MQQGTYVTFKLTLVSIKLQRSEILREATYRLWYVEYTRASI